MSYVTKGAMCMIFTADLKDAKTGAVQRVAVKVPRTDCEDPAVAEHDLEVELDILRGLHHKHIIKLVRCFVYIPVYRHTRMCIYVYICVCVYYQTCSVGL
jgi:Protein tyrosine and serine/threonine kinase